MFAERTSGPRTWNSVDGTGATTTLPLLSVTRIWYLTTESAANGPICVPYHPSPARLSP